MKRTRSGEESPGREGKDDNGLDGSGREELDEEETVPEIVLLRRRNIARNAAMMAALSFDKVLRWGSSVLLISMA